MLIYLHLSFIGGLGSECPIGMLIAVCLKRNSSCCHLSNPSSLPTFLLLVDFTQLPEPATIESLLISVHVTLNVLLVP